MTPTFKYERQLWKKGYKVVAGADEVGRGAWAGPIVAGAIVFALAPQNPKSKFQIPNETRIDDSKKLTARRRERAEKWIKKNALSWGIGQASPGEINRLGLGKASKVAFRKAVANCNRNLAFSIWNPGKEKEKASPKIQNSRFKIQYLLIDAFYLPYTRGIRRKNQLAIINGDEKCFSIAAASIIAKVYRDRLMRKLARKYPKYGWKRNKGYGTKEHQEAIRRYGITKLHRRQFVSDIQKTDFIVVN